MTKPTAIIDNHYASTSHNLAKLLPAATVSFANATQLAFDARFSEWLASTLKVSSITVQADTVLFQNLICFELKTSHGELAFGLEPLAWPALKLVAELPDTTLAISVANVMLEPLVMLLAPVLGNIVVSSVGIDQASRTHALFLHANNQCALLLGCDATLVRYVRSFWSNEQLAADVTLLCRLLLRGRIVYMQRSLPTHILYSLAPGDVVLSPGAQTGVKFAFISVGCGFALKANIAINFKEHTVQVVDTPIIENETQITENSLPLMSINELQLPISFELDTARVSLAELAAMRPGYSIELDLPLNEVTVQLVCQGQTVGQGQLIAIGDQVGVRITRMSFRDE